MRVSTGDWDDIVMMTKAAILTWQASAEAHGVPDKFTITVASREGRTALLTKQMDGTRQIKAACIMRFDNGGGLFPCRWDDKARKWKPKAAPQSWIALQGNPIEIIWKALKLADFAPLKESVGGRS